LSGLSTDFTDDTDWAFQGLDERDRQTYLIIGCAMEVHRYLGSQFLEPVYQAALEVELDAKKIPFVREIEMPVLYKGHPLSVRYRADFVCFEEVLVELKAMERLTDREDSQVVNYLNASQIKRGLLLNFGAASLQFRRFVGPDPKPPHLCNL
jgi:GxxExxY protein